MKEDSTIYDAFLEKEKRADRGNAASASSNNIEDISNKKSSQVKKKIKPDHDPRKTEKVSFDVALSQVGVKPKI